VMMNDDEKKQRIATFRYGVISDFVGGASLDYGDKVPDFTELTGPISPI
jgi:hypothetical protein